MLIALYLKKSNVKLYHTLHIYTVHEMKFQGNDFRACIGFCRSSTPEVLRQTDNKKPPLTLQVNLQSGQKYIPTYNFKKSKYRFIKLYFERKNIFFVKKIKKRIVAHVPIICRSSRCINIKGKKKINEIP